MSEQLRAKRHLLPAAWLFAMFWICDSLVDAVYFRHVSWVDELLRAETREFSMRLISAACLAGLYLAVAVLGDRRRKMETALRHSDELAESFFRSSRDAICIIASDGLAITAANDVFLAKFSLSHDQVLGASFSQLASQNLLPSEMVAQVKEAAASGVPSSGEISYRGACGLKRYEEISCHPIGDPSQGIRKVLHVARDITVRRSAESLLKESEARYRAFFESTGTAMAIVLPDGLLHMVNNGFESVTGYRREELEGKMHWTEFVTPEGEDFVPQPDAMFGETPEKSRHSFELQIVDRFGEKRAMAGNWAVVAGTGQAVLSLVDIAEQKRVEEALRQSQATLAVAQRIARLGNWEWDLTRDEVTWSEEMFRIYAQDPASYLPTFDSFVQVLHPEDREIVVRTMNESIYNRKPYHLDFRIILGGGVTRTISSSAEITYDEHGTPLRMIGTNQDVTWRNEAEEALRMSEEKFSKAFHASPDPIVVTRADDGVYIDVNEAFLECTGYTRPEVIGKSSLEIGVWAEPEGRMKMLRLLNQQGHVRNLDVKFRIKSGDIRELLWSADVIEYNGQACLIAVSRDVTDQRNLERELVASDARLFMKHEELKNLFHQMEGIRREWEQTMDCISDLFILSDQWGKIRRFNRAVEIFTGMAHRDIVGQDYVSFLEQHGLKAHLDAPGREIYHRQSGKRLVLKSFAFPTREIDGSTREVVIISDTSDLALQRENAPVRLVPRRPKAH
jgi:PAS domain S-box-containing protein